jgi:hypothetical protein
MRLMPRHRRLPVAVDFQRIRLESIGDVHGGIGAKANSLGIPRLASRSNPLPET